MDVNVDVEVADDFADVVVVLPLDATVDDGMLSHTAPDAECRLEHSC